MITKKQAQFYERNEGKRRTHQKITFKLSKYFTICSHNLLLHDELIKFGVKH